MAISPGRKVFSPLNILSSVLGILLLIVLLRQIDFATLFRSILAVHPGLLALGGGVYLLKSSFRSLRFLHINEQPASEFFRMLRLTLASSLASQLLPLKLGELAYVYLIKKDFQAGLSRGVSTLLIVRIFDLLAISLLFILSAIVFHLPGGLSNYFSSVLGTIAFLLALLAGLVAAGKFFPRLAGSPWLTGLTRRYTVADKVWRGLSGVLSELGEIRGRQYTWMIGLAAVEWTLNFAMFHILLLGMGMSTRIFDTITAVTFAALASVLPLNSFGNFGTQEAGWATGLVLLGHPQGAALTSGFATHLLSLAYFLGFGGIAWIAYMAGAAVRSRISFLRQP